MSLVYDKEYTYIFHSPGIEPWITGFLKKLREKDSLGEVLDVGCGLGLTGFLLKLYVGGVERLVGVDISSERISRARQLNVYDELYATDIKEFKGSRFDVVICLEVLHGLPGEVLMHIESLVKEGGSAVLALPRLPRGISVRDLIDRGYSVYRYLLRGFLLVDLKSYSILSIEGSIFLEAIRFALNILKPLLKVTRILERGYMLAFR